MITTIVVSILVIFFYLAPAHSVWRYLHLAHSKGGVYENTPLSAPDFMLVVVPMVNWIASIDLWNTRHPLKDCKNRPKFYNWFFNIK